VFRHLLAGEIDVREAARRLHQLAPTGLAVHSSLLAPEEQLRLDALAPALRWEMAKKVIGSLPDVPYGSPQHQELMANSARWRFPPTTYHVLRIRISFWGREIPWLSRLVAAVVIPVLRWRRPDKHWGWTNDP
jgi:hypothetical protein